MRFRWVLFILILLLSGSILFAKEEKNINNLGLKEYKIFLEQMNSNIPEGKIIGEEKYTGIKQKDLRWLIDLSLTDETQKN